MIPSRFQLLLLLAWTLVGVGGGFDSRAFDLWAALGGMLALALAIDALLAWRTPAPDVKRSLAPAISMGVRTAVSLDFENRYRWPLTVCCWDDVPDALEAPDLPQTVRLEPDGGTRLTYRVRPLRRGPAHFGAAQLRVRSPLGLWERRHRVAGSQEVRVYPNFGAVARYQLLATEHRTSQLGIRTRPRRGSGREFHQLREYRAGDPLRQVDWKATARLRRAISREYQDERDQQVLLLLDCGRRMRSQDGDTGHLDAALDAALLLAHVALRQGDAVGMLTLGGPERWLAPRKGAGQLNALLNTLYDLQPAPRASDYLAACRQVATRVRKRTLVILISNLRDEDGSELGAGLGLLARRHLVLLASLREAILEDSLAAPVRDAADARRVAATHLYLKERRLAHASLQHAGALLLDVRAQELPALLVNGYLDVKSAGLL